ncbi:hypothetical protein [Sphingorhabdus sp. M41]|uniref:hypothetical protein n=1 Tax=Sphingorhabdus sp. M41 TaxID=1806885 RepID=UPI002FF62B91
MAAENNQSLGHEFILSHFPGRWIAVGRRFSAFCVQHRPDDDDTGMGDDHLPDGGVCNAVVKYAAEQHFIHLGGRRRNDYWLALYRELPFGFGLAGNRGLVDFRMPDDRPVIH